MPVYRLFCKSSEGKVIASENLDFDSDEEAIAYARDKHAEGNCELWSMGELVADLKRGAVI